MKIKSKSDMSAQESTQETLNKMDEKWFSQTSELLMSGQYTYAKKRRIQIPKPERTETRPLTISNLRVKVIERAFLDVLEPFLEGMWEWKNISETEYKALKTNTLIAGNQYKQTKKGYFKKI